MILSMQMGSKFPWAISEMLRISKFLGLSVNN